MAMLTTKVSDRSGEAANERTARLDNYSCVCVGGEKIDLPPQREGGGGGIETNDLLRKVQVQA